jgi:hypothetical protein
MLSLGSLSDVADVQRGVAPGTCWRGWITGQGALIDLNQTADKVGPPKRFQETSVSAGTNTPMVKLLPTVTWTGSNALGTAWTVATHVPACIQHATAALGGNRGLLIQIRSSEVHTPAIASHRKATASVYGLSSLQWCLWRVLASGVITLCSSSKFRNNMSPPSSEAKSCKKMSLNMKWQSKQRWENSCTCVFSYLDFLCFLVQSCLTYTSTLKTEIVPPKRLWSFVAL